MILEVLSFIRSFVYLAIVPALLTLAFGQGRRSRWRSISLVCEAGLCIVACLATAANGFGDIRAYRSITSLLTPFAALYLVSLYAYIYSRRKHV